MTKASKSHETVRIDSLQAQYLKYMSALAGTPIAAIVREAIEDYLNIQYSIKVSALEQKGGLARTTSDSGTAKDLQNAFNNMLRNLKTIESARQRRHLAASA